MQPEPNNQAFPQADKFERVLDLLQKLRSGSLSQEDITQDNDFDVRQTQYYTSAARYLGLIERRHDAELGVLYSLSLEGRRIMQLNAVDRNLALIKVILSHAVFKDSLSLYLRQQEVPSVDQVVGIMAKANLQITESTLGRRAQTVIGWLKWITDLTRSG